MRLRGIRGQSGQGITEYILLLAVVVSIAMLVGRWLPGLEIEKKLLASLSKGVARSYESGNPNAIGPLREGGPVHHPRVSPSGEVRIFLNPRRGSPGSPP